ncbi:hypothetical protein B0H19DRAFT_373261 [Mycena capillaripes]|nr:hypothetical protein B0H19DRAFT_373261 [Mycena capillaripes]
MVLTRRQFKAITRWLPNEIISEIIQAAPRRANRASLCRASKLFHSIGVQALYREVDLDSYPRVISFSSAVLSNPALSELVRSFTFVKCEEPSHGYELVDFSQSLLDCLTSLHRLEHMSINLEIFEEEQWFALLNGTFHHLVGFQIFGELEKKQFAATSSFLIRHPQLISLGMMTYDPFEPSCRIPLSNLRHFRGPASLIPSLQASCVTEAWIDWDYLGSHSVERIVIGLRSMTCNHAPIICCNDGFGHDFSEISRSLSNYIPQMKMLQLETHELDSDVTQLLFENLKSCLPSWGGLRFLSFEDHFDLYYGRSHPERDMALLKAFGDLIPTLEACRLSKPSAKS